MANEQETQARIGLGIIGALLLLVLGFLIYDRIAAQFTPEKKAERLFTKGKYEQLVEEYPESLLRQEALSKIAEKLFQNGDYGSIDLEYISTEWYSKARYKEAEALFRQGNYYMVAFPSGLWPNYFETDIYKKSVDSVAEQLYNRQSWDSLKLSKFYDSPAQKRYLATPGVKEAIERDRQQEAKQRQKAVAGSRDRFLNDPAGFFKRGRLKAGMSANEVRSAIGYADDENTTSVGGLSTMEQWVYERGDFDMIFLYFENGVLTSWQY